MSNQQNKVAEKVFDGVTSLLGLLLRVGFCGFKRILGGDNWLPFWSFVLACLYLTYHYRYLTWVYKFWPWLFHSVGGGTFCFLFSFWEPLSLSF